MGEHKRVGAKDIVSTAVGIAIAVTAIVGVLMLRADAQRRRNRQPTIDVAEHVRYVHDQRADVCFALTWTGEDERRTYLMAWVPCMERLPVASFQTPSF